MSQVIIQDVLPRTQITATAGQTVFNTNWTADATTDIEVYARATGVEPDDITQLVSPSLYNVTFIGGSETVRITFLSGRTLDDIITIVRNTPPTRMNLYINTNFTPDMLNEDFGILTLVDQQAQLYDTVVNPGYNVSAIIDPVIDTILPILDANQIWAMNPTRTEIIPYDVPASGTLAPGDATYLLQVANGDLPNAQAMGALASGFVVNTTTSGVQLTRLLTGVSQQISIGNTSGIAGNPSIGIAPNPVFPGNQGVGLPPGTTLQRPVTPVGTNLRFNSTLIILEYWDGASWVQLSETDGVVTVTGTQFQVLANGTFAIPQDGAVILTLPQNIDPTSSPTFNNITLTSGTISAIPTALFDIANKAYVDTIATGITVQGACFAGTTANLTGYVYNNGALGVGATLTAGSNGAFSTDGVSPALNSRILVKNESSTFQNGIYTLSTVGDGSNPAVLTRATDYNEPSEISPGDLVIITNGTTLIQSSWVETATVTAVGTDPIIFVQFSSALPISMQSGGTGSSISPIANAVFSTNGSSQGQLSTTLPSGLTIPGYAHSGANSDITSMTGLTGALRAPTSILDANGNIEISFSSTASAVNYIDFLNNASTGTPESRVMGSDTNIHFIHKTKGTGAHFFYGAEGTTIPVAIRSGTAYQHLTHLVIPNSAATRNVTFQDSDGTLAYLADRGMVLLGSATASASAAITFTSVTGYTNYMIVWNALTPSTAGAQLLMQASIDNGATWLNAAGSYFVQNLYLVNTSITAAADSTSLTSAPLTTSVVGTVSGPSGYLIFENLNTTARKGFTGHGVYINNATGTMSASYIAGWIPSSSSVNAVRLIYSSGNIASGVVQLYGLK